MEQINNIQQSSHFAGLLNRAYICARKLRHEFVLPEHLLLALIDDDLFYSVLNNYSDPEELELHVKEKLNEMEMVPVDVEAEPEISVQFKKMLQTAVRMLEQVEDVMLDIHHLVYGLLELKDSWACYLLLNALQGEATEFLNQLAFLVLDERNSDQSDDEEVRSRVRPEDWRMLVTCMNDVCDSYHPLVGREKELERTIQVLCRRDKNNPLHVGEPGVGKTALVWGLVHLIQQGKVPTRLQGCRVYQFDLGSILAGTQYRGDLEGRVKKIMDGILQESANNIVYIDEIHTLVGAGAIGDSAMDASNLLKPYLESHALRFIGSTTYEEYNRYFSKSKGLVRRFQQIDIAEPSVDEAKHILMQLKPLYEEFHGVTFTPEAINYAVEISARHINDRCLPDKAIDLIDEAGAAMEMNPNPVPVDKGTISAVLAKTSRADAQVETEMDDLQRLESLQDRILEQIYGQSEAVKQVVEAVQMAKAGLIDENKPLAALLFVGPTGVGKTEVARVLASEMGVNLVRFDMSEYTEKHAVAKLIGSPAGYVGYEDGGLLTDAVRKTPQCVLLLDEIEKAHPDIFNILLQVMDYARLTDNKGHQVDFRNVVMILTSNAGAQYASQASVGFSSSVSRGEAMLRQVKRTFKPEFLNRLSGTVVFHDMDREMATLILQKKMRQLSTQLAARGVQVQLADEVFQHLLTAGYSPEYGAREMDRVIASQLKPLLMRQILFGKLKQGGNANIVLRDGNISID